MPRIKKKEKKSGRDKYKKIPVFFSPKQSSQFTTKGVFCKEVGIFTDNDFKAHGEVFLFEEFANCRSETIHKKLGRFEEQHFLCKQKHCVIVSDVQF
jgi:hypothetical protein